MYFGDIITLVIKKLEKLPKPFFESESRQEHNNTIIKSIQMLKNIAFTILLRERERERARSRYNSSKKKKKKKIENAYVRTCVFLSCTLESPNMFLWTNLLMPIK